MTLWSLFSVGRPLQSDLFPQYNFLEENLFVIASGCQLVIASELGMGACVHSSQLQDPIWCGPV